MQDHILSYTQFGHASSLSHPRLSLLGPNVTFDENLIGGPHGWEAWTQACWKSRNVWVEKPTWRFIGIWVRITVTPLDNFISNLQLEPFYSPYGKPL